MSDKLLDINNLSVSFRSDGQWSTAVDNVNFYINKGETLGIVGESGSGKSVTALSVMGLLPFPPARIDKGSILFYPAGDSVDLLKTEEKKFRQYRGKHMGMIFQEPMTSLNPVMRCGKQVMEILTLHEKLSPKAAADRTIRLFEEVKLPRVREMFAAWPHQLSGGQKQRVMIAMAIACNPALLIADEPTTALDVTVQKTILELLRELREKRGMSVLFISHDLSVVRQVANRVIVMYKGKIVESGDTKSIFTDPQHPYTRGLLSCRPPLQGRPLKLTTVADFMKNEDDNNGFTPEVRLQSPLQRQQAHNVLYQNEPFLTVDKVDVTFPLKKNWLGKTLEILKAVDNVSVNVYPGETLGLVGESGCGKTTLGRAVLALIGTSAGQIRLDGHDLSHESRHSLRKLRKNFQIIFQDPYSSLNPRLTVGSCITEPMKVHQILRNARQRKEKAMELLKKVGLEDLHFYRYPHEFSGGQRQRICIARALALQPKFIVCDESVSALDISVQAQVLNLLNDLKKEFGFTYIFISHDLSVVKYMSDRMIVMKDGKIVESGEADQVYDHPSQDYTLSLINAIPG